jgi:hypothetical protein
MYKSLELANRCPFCGLIQTVRVSPDSYKEYKGGALAQNAFPYLDGDEREIIISGICPECWPED